MPLEIALKAAEFLLKHRGANLRLDFGGGEPLMNFDVVREASSYAATRAREIGKKLSFYMVTNAIRLDEAILEVLLQRNFLLELSIDGDSATHNRFKLPYERGLDPYLATRRGVEKALRSGVRYFVIVVASPDNVEHLSENFEHLLDIGVRNIDISYALGTVWARPQADALFREINRILRRHRRPMERGEIHLGNRRARLEPSILNSELMVDTDGTLHLLSEWMFETTRPQFKAPYHLGSLDDAGDINSLYWSQFHCYYTLAKMHEGNPDLRKIILNNIGLGLRVGRFFSNLGRTLS